MATMAENLEQLAADKQSIAENLTAMGAEAETSESMAALAAKILSIPQSSIKIARGTFTPSKNISSDYVIEHGLGEMPDFVVVYITNSCATTQRLFLEIYDSANTVSNYVGTTGTFGSVTITQATSPQKLTIDAENITIHATNSMMLNNGTTYAWIAIKE